MILNLSHTQGSTVHPSLRLRTRMARQDGFGDAITHIIPTQRSGQ
ncbi:MAG TPA: hypothetical protein PLR74_00310 [Agriterribacter sp.]|nr:hypothetical protein [Agriterribacter sp.]